MNIFGSLQKKHFCKVRRKGFKVLDENFSMRGRLKSSIVQNLNLKSDFPRYLLGKHS